MSEETTIMTMQENIQLGMLVADGPSGVIQKASVVAAELAKIINDRKLYTTISGRKFVQVEGWETLGAMLGVLPREVPPVLRHEDGTYEAVVELVRVGDQAIIGRGSAICGVDEKTWANRPEYARRSMAITRATGKAYRLAFSWIMTLAGYQPTPAEEMDSVIVEGEAREVRQPAGMPALRAGQAAKPSVKPSNGGSNVDAIYQAVVDAKLSENIHAAKSTLQKYCQTGFDTEEKALAWMKLFRGWRDTDKTPEQAAKEANAGNVPK